MWALTIGTILIVLLHPKGYEVFSRISTSHTFLMAFFKFAILATLGELLAIRIKSGFWTRPAGLHWRAFVWGLFGMLIALVFYLFASGVTSAMEIGLLPSAGTDTGINRLAFALFTSLLMNLLFAPTFMAAHRITDTYIDCSGGSIQAMIQLSLSDVLKQIDWNGFISFVVCRTIPFFWVPAHTITFLLAPEQRVLVAAFLSIALGAILAGAKRQNNFNEEHTPAG